MLQIKGIVIKKLHKCRKSEVLRFYPNPKRIGAFFMKRGLGKHLSCQLIASGLVSNANKSATKAAVNAGALMAPLK
ncbi:MAG: hypothetical protein WCO04_00045 [Pseudomonadota bacterium]